MINIAILASGSGSNAENIIRYFQKNNSINVVLVVSNKKDAYVLERARVLGVEAVYFPKSEWEEADNVCNTLRRHGVHFIVLAGFLLKIPGLLLRNYPGGIVNIHPALLPKYGGKGMYGDKVHEAVVAAGEEKTGITIHYVNEFYDEGEVIFQAECPVLPSDLPQDVAAKVHLLEYEHYPRIIEKVASGL